MPKSTVKLISAEGFEFIVDYKAACVSNTIRNMLSSSGARRRGRTTPPSGARARG
jgi:transcription elongation factor B subunit 1